MYFIYITFLVLFPLNLFSKKSPYFHFFAFIACFQNGLGDTSLGKGSL